MRNEKLFSRQGRQGLSVVVFWQAQWNTGPERRSTGQTKNKSDVELYPLAILALLAGTYRQALS